VIEVLTLMQAGGYERISHHSLIASDTAIGNFFFVLTDGPPVDAFPQCCHLGIFVSLFPAHDTRVLPLSFQLKTFYLPGVRIIQTNHAVWLAPETSFSTVFSRGIGSA